MRIFGITGRKNTGKTTLVEKLVAEIIARGFRVSTVKHAHHDTDVDHPGRDSHRHRMAGAEEVLLASARRWALMHELRGREEPELAEHLARLERVDLVLVEGFKQAAHPKIETLRAQIPGRPLAPDHPSIRAVASDQGDPGLGLPAFDLDDVPAIADFILRETGLDRLRRTDSSMPPGVDWTPVPEVLARLREAISPLAEVETLPLAQAAGRVLAEDALARRSHPPAANSAVDGYGYAFDTVDFNAGPVPLAEGRAAAGVPYERVLAPGQALRILTGAALPEGVDTVVLQEDARIEAGRLHVSRAPKRPGANVRHAGEDMAQGAVALKAGRVLGAPELGLAAALGITTVAVRPRLRVGVLSTGAELVDLADTARGLEAGPEAGPEAGLEARLEAGPGPGPEAGPGQEPGPTVDANRPMLLAALERLGYQAVDLGIVTDERAAIRAALDGALGRVDAILTSGGASQGDEDHVSALLREEGDLRDWRVAIKPGRPLALAHWGGADRIPVFGLPGNPVAAMVCTVVFAAPALAQRAGAGWHEPRGFTVAAGFTKVKQAGRHEYLRARIDAEGRAEVFVSEGSGRISGLVWAEGLVELTEEARDIQPGDPVRYIPWSGFGL